MLLGHTIAERDQYDWGVLGRREIALSVLQTRDYTCVAESIPEIVEAVAELLSEDTVYQVGQPGAPRHLLLAAGSRLSRQGAPVLGTTTTGRSRAADVHDGDDDCAREAQALQTAEARMANRDF
jgi:hypothetical protein